MTVRKRKDTGKWTCDFYYNGERIVRTLQFVRTRKEAEQAEAVIMHKVFQQAYGLARKPDVRFEDFVIETFLPYSEANKKSFRCDVLICRVLAKHFKGFGLRQITPPVIENFKQVFMKTPTKFGGPRSNATVNYHLSVLSKILSMAVDAEILEVNPSQRVKKLRVNNERMRVLSGDEETRLIAALAPNVQVRRLVLLALHTGMRRGEILNLRWLDIDFQRDTIVVQMSKSGRKRIVPMNKTVRSMLGEIARVSEFVFPSEVTGRPVVEIKRSFGTAMKKAGIRDLRFHDLRHTAATRMADGGADAFTLMKILGHSDIRMTARYTHATDSAIRRAVTNLDENRVFSDGLATKVRNPNLKLTLKKVNP